MQTATIGRILILTSLLLAITGTQSLAQYFGSNKVRYKDFDFQVLRSDNFEVHYYPEEEQAAEEAARLAERWRARLGRVLEHQLPSRQPIILYASHPHFEQTNVIEGFIGESTGGVTEGLKRRVVLPFASGMADTNHVLGHELVHAYQYDMARDKPGGMNLPLWFVEGMAEYLSLGSVDGHTAMWLRDAARSERLPHIRDLSNPRFFPYRFGQALWAYLAGRWGDGVVGLIYREALISDPIAAIEKIIGVKEEELSRQWHEAIHQAYGDMLRGASAEPRGSRPLTPDANEGELNVAPSISPDGKHVVYLSSRDLLSIDLFLADAETGRIVRQLSSSAVDPHLDSLQFIGSAGSWDRSGTRFAYSSIQKGQAVLTILDIPQRRTMRELVVTEVDEIFSPTWSPDGRSLAFSGIRGGLTDLYVYDLERQSARRLTNDLFADLQPAWSPDGRTIAFITDRFSVRSDALSFDPPRVALLDLQQGTVRLIEGFGAGTKHLNPQWGGDGQSLYFLADPDGVTNLYRIDLSGGRLGAPGAAGAPGSALSRLTDLVTGVSGITAMSPALSVSQTGRSALAVYSDGRHRIFALDADRAGTIPLPALSRRAATLPPVDRRASEIEALLRNPTLGLPSRQDFPSRPYSPQLQLDYIGEPFLVTGANQFGTFLGGGTGFLFSDMLGDHTVATAVQVQGGFKDIAGQALYINREKRWGWGGLFEQVPYTFGQFSQQLATVDGETALVERTLRFRQTERQLVGIMEYPFSRAQRFEFSAGVRMLSFDQDLITQAFSLRSGTFLGESEQSLPAPDGLVFGQASAALVYDTALIGPTSPLLGMRYRFEVMPTVNTLSFTNLLFDVRRYVMPFRPVTLAGRLFHYGRYGSDSEDSRLTPLFLGYPNLVRGYDFDSLDASECLTDGVLDGGSRCPVLDRLMGSRMLVANAELRFPLVGVFTGEIDWGPVPLEGLLFADAGVAWTRNERPDFAGGSRSIVRSVGAGFRVNALGYAVLEFDAVRPLDRPGRGWMFAFTLQPGF